MSIGIVKDPELLAMARSMGFKGTVLVDMTEPFTVAFVSDRCYMCDKPWTVKCLMESEPEDECSHFYLCDDHLKHAQEKWPRHLVIQLRRLDILEEKVKEASA